MGQAPGAPREAAGGGWVGGVGGEHSHGQSCDRRGTVFGTWARSAVVARVGETGIVWAPL